MPFGFWVLGNGREGQEFHDEWSRVSNAFRLLGSGEPRQGWDDPSRFALSQMPFGFWVLGNDASKNALLSVAAVSNAFRLLGSGELEPFFWVCHEIIWVSNAFRLLGSGEPCMESGTQPRRRRSLKCLSAFGFWGT